LNCNQARLGEVYGLTPIEAGNVLLAAVITYQIGIVSFGPLDHVLDTRKWIAVGGTLVTIAMLAVLALASHPPVWVPIGAILCMGFFSVSSTMVMTHGRGIFPGPADRPRRGDHVRRRLHADALRHHRRRVRAVG
jgi:MFS family permease